MTRTIGGPLTSHLATRSHTRCKMLLMVLADGTSIGLTDHDRILNFNLGDGAVDYLPDTGILPSAIAASVGFEADNFEVSGPIGDLITRAAVLGGRYDRARVYLFEVNWKSLGSGAIKLLAGNVSQATIKSGKFVFEVRSDADKFNQTIGELITPYCSADFGDARCGLNLGDFDSTGEVTAVVDAMRFTVSYTGTLVDDFMNAGTLVFTSGELMDIAPVEIFDWAATGDLQLFEPLPEVPAIGDDITLRLGCAKTRTACMAFANIVNFRGFPEVPGSDQVLKYANPGSGGG